MFRKVREPNQHEAALIIVLGPIAGHPGGEPLVGYLNSEEKVHETGSKDSGKQVAKEKTVRKANGNGVRGEPAGNPPA